MSETRLALFAVSVCLSAAAAAADSRWMLMSRHGECEEIASLKRRVPDLGDVADPAAFAAHMRRAGYKADSSELADTGGKAVQVKVPEKNLSLVFVSRELCKNK